jgi:hypothetical protein
MFQTKRTDPFGPVIVVIKEQSYKNLQYDHSFPAYGQQDGPLSVTQPTAPDQRPYLIASLAPLHGHEHPVIFVVAEAVTTGAGDRAGSLTDWKLKQQGKDCQWQNGAPQETPLGHLWCEFDDFVAYNIVSALGENFQIFTKEGGDRDEFSETLQGSFKEIADYKKKNPTGYEDMLKKVRGAFRLRVFGLNTNYVRAYSQLGFHSTVSWFELQMAQGGDYHTRIDELAQIFRPLGDWAGAAFKYDFPTKSQRICFDQIKAIGKAGSSPYAVKVNGFAIAAQRLYAALKGMQTGESPPPTRRTATDSWRR